MCDVKLKIDFFLYFNEPKNIVIDGENNIMIDWEYISKEDKNRQEIRRFHGIL